ncbi:glycosyltransferase family A protein [Phocaeicola salanitronis]|uniref:glycosyltransferase family A protein n=1 Tax=Phocaeicola salanitronis TaxID=376805 RepID=UPI0023F62891|nr:glycosyltransferase family A protein [Phocaeicola salanitronis]
MKTYYSNLKDGLTGLIRTRNEGALLEACIDSCINALDELIVVCFDCTDNTHEVLERKKVQYPTKLRVLEYNHKVLSFDLTREEFDYAMALPDDSPRLYHNMCNFVLSQSNYKYIMKIDADQIYFEDEIKKWRDVCSGDLQIKWSLSLVWGWFFMMFFTLYRRLSAKFGKPYLWMLPDWFVKSMFKSYQKYAMWRLKCGTACVSFSGINVFKDDKWYALFTNPPYNGEGDHVIFKWSDDTYYVKRYSDKVPYSVTDNFNNPYKVMYAPPAWFHLNANRVQSWGKVKKMKDEHPECFVPIEEFSKMSYKEVYDKVVKKARTYTLYQMILFVLAHKMGKSIIERNVSLLK